MKKSLPKTGLPWDKIKESLCELAINDIDWKRGRTPLYIFFANDSVLEIGKNAFMQYFSENALGGKRAFFSVKRMEEEVVEMSLDLLNAPESANGCMTTGGSESIFLAVKACRDHFRANSSKNALNMVVPFSAHPAFNKAGDVLDIEVKRVPLKDDFRADPAAMAKKIDERTIMLVGSAPCFPHGVIDPINDIAETAQREGIWLHVDACVGGYIAPFARKLGHTIPEFDFAISGVRSMSADLHKFGFCPKPASVVLYADNEDFQNQIFNYDVWPNGRFSTATLVGTRPAGSVAAAWSVFHYLGESGYLKIVKRILSMTRKYVEGIKAIDELHMWAEPDLSIINFGSQFIDIFSVAEEFSKSGWLPGLTQNPRGMHLMMSLIHEPVREEFLQTLKSAIKKVIQFRTKSSIQAEY